MNSIETLSKNLKKIRISKQMSQSDLALAIGVSRQNVWNIENGRAWIDSKTLDKIVYALGIEFSDLFTKLN